LCAGSNVLCTARQITFENGNRASLVTADAEADAAELLAEVGLEPEGERSVVVVIGGADTLNGESLERATAVIGPGLVRAADLVDAAVIDGGTAAGVMAIVGDAVAQTGDGRPPLLGVAPAGLVSYPGADASANDAALEPNHSHFVLAPGAEWGSETLLLLQLAETLAAGGRVVAVLVGGGEIAKAEAVAAVRRKWSLVVVDRTGGVADEVARRCRGGEKGSGSTDPDLDEIAAADSVRLFDGPTSTHFGRDLAWELQDQPTLKRVWRTFAGYNDIANRARGTFSRFQAAIVVLGIGGTFLALLDNAREFPSWGEDVVHWIVVAVPILLSLMIALAVRLGFGKRWVLMRGASEAMKSEIYRYRSRTGIYRHELRPDGLSRQEMLAIRVNAVDERLLTTEASSWPLSPYDGPLPPEMFGASVGDDGLSPLDADRYLDLRVGDQLAYYYPKAAKLGRQLRALQVLALASGAVGTLLAAAGYEVWIGLTTAIAANVVAYLGYLQVEPTLIAYNQAAARLEGLRRDWDAQPAGKRDFGRLVDRSEGVLATELSGWVQQMNQAIEEAARSGAATAESPGEDGRHEGRARGR
jgi:23S rRNA pseudoU1915 N3-methylase RlmH